jgi:hypothetical protein
MVGVFMYQYSYKLGLHSKVYLTAITVALYSPLELMNLMKAGKNFMIFKTSVCTTYLDFGRDGLLETKSRVLGKSASKCFNSYTALSALQCVYTFWRRSR